MGISATILGDVLGDVLGDELGDTLGGLDLPEIAGLVSRWRADAGNITLNGGDVSGWAESFLSHDLAQLTALNQPTYNTTPINGHPTVQFNANDFMTTPDAPDLDMGVGSFLVLMVVQRPQVSSFRVAWAKGTSASADNVRGFINSTDKLQLFWGSDGQSYSASTLTISNNVPELVGWGIDSSSNQVLYIQNNTVQRMAVTISGTGSNALPFRFHGDGTGATYDDDAWGMPESVIYKRGVGVAFTDAEIQSLYNDYFQPYYAL